MCLHINLMHRLAWAAASSRVQMATTLALRQVTRMRQEMLAGPITSLCKQHASADPRKGRDRQHATHFGLWIPHRLNGSHEGYNGRSSIHTGRRVFGLGSQPEPRSPSIRFSRTRPHAEAAQ